MSLSKTVTTARKSLKLSAMDEFFGKTKDNVTLACTAELSSASLNNQGKRGKFKTRSRQHG